MHRCHESQTRILMLCATTAIILRAQTFTILHSFDGTDGYNPAAALVQGMDGNLYGVTVNDGANGGGTVFKVTPSGALTVLHNFCSQSSCTDGENSFAGLVLAAGGDFYGTTANGGTNSSGTVFKITPNGTLTTLYSFCSESGCTGSPLATLVQAANGDLYGTSPISGANNHGTIFKLTPSGTPTTLYSFCSLTQCTDGSYPYAGLIQSSNGDLYGTTLSGGAADGGGTFFKITPGGALTTLYSFCSQNWCAGGAYPYAALVQATNGDFYGTTYQGGTNNYGTVYKITPDGVLTTLYSFCSLPGCLDGYYPYSGLVQATDGNLYGTTLNGGAYGPNTGTIFKITPGGTLTTLHNFCSQPGCADGNNPQSLVQATNGDLYGTATSGGTNNDGTVFSMSVGLGPFVKTLPASGAVGSYVEILGTDLNGTTSVKFNGTPAVFTVMWRHLITATVPAGASTGKVEAATPNGTLSSNVPFRVP
jgi:uncharacterized repeat protein (TIGR03803 family)